MTFKLTGIALAVAFAFATAAQAQTPQTTPKRDADKPRSEQTAPQRADTGSAERKAKDAEEERIEAQAKADKAKCDPMKGNAKDICMAEAKGKEKVAKAELDAKYDKSPKAQRKAAETKAEGQYEVAKQKCDDQKGQQHDACMAQAKANHEKAKANIRAQYSPKDKERSASSGQTAPRTDTSKRQ